ncbi:Zinc (Zn2)-Iron (Fe2) Permease (ZIP) Family [Thraustotheca clavata]|uniref:Zinc (Zn2)-Iron (Fe2) Permease (ZIP) Family n=1 Tax=Thraustotheca clavata TaxID=74557 RepID=A0A1W0A060_9STRA|nr:Zinc (Zn2)-Iron (Fe2) Permease (ZIP) Family [Thraustotheca clavata]
MPEFTSNVGVAFALSSAAAFATCLGGLVIFSASLVKMANPKNLSMALALAGGVMVFVSLVEIFNESVKQFKIAGEDDNGVCSTTCEGNAWVFTNLAFIVGAIIIYGLDALVHRLSPELKDEMDVADLSRLERAVDGRELLSTPADNRRGSLGREGVSPADKEALVGRERDSMNRTGILTAVALAIHNLPEGIATYTAAVKDLKVGATLAIGIALHNIPEGIAVATPVYFATNNRWRAFCWACASALAEPLGAILAWIILGKGLNPALEGAMFGLVAGMMVTLSIKELIPSAVKFCPEGNAVSIAILGGMGIMSLSLILFAYVGI